MPKATRGVLVQCDPPQMAMILKLDSETGGAYVSEAIDDRTCLIKESKCEELKRRVKQLMDEAMGADSDDEQDKDSDLD